MSTTTEPAPSTRRDLPLGWILLGGIVLLSAGIGLGFAMDRSHPARPHAPPHVSSGPARDVGPGGPMREQLKERFEERRGEMREFRGELREWSEPLEKIQDRTLNEIAKVLRPEQKERLSEVRKVGERRGEARRPGPPVMDYILIQPRLERLSDLLVLDKDQSARIETLLKKQREEVIAWLDTNPPPKPAPRAARMHGPEGGPDKGHRPGGPRPPSGPAS